MNRRSLLMTGTAVLLTAIPHAKAEAPRKLNFIVILCDDLGFGDIQPFGNRFLKTPNLMRMAREGMVLTDYYAPANICTPSRAGLLTGRYPIRTGLGWNVILPPISHRILLLFPFFCCQSPLNRTQMRLISTFSGSTHLPCSRIKSTRRSTASASGMLNFTGVLPT